MQLLVENVQLSWLLFITGWTKITAARLGFGAGMGRFDQK
jgi:hypothetical protein